MTEGTMIKILEKKDKVIISLPQGTANKISSLICWAEAAIGDFLQKLEAEHGKYQQNNQK
jgi:hypothetical protein